jgi:hypothetical protein
MLLRVHRRQQALWQLLMQLLQPHCVRLWARRVQSTADGGGMRSWSEAAAAGSAR